MKRLNFKVIIIVMLILSFSIVIHADNSNIIISPTKLEGVIGEDIPQNSVYVQEVTLTNARLIDVHIMNKRNQVMTKFPKESGRYVLQDKATRKGVGYINLEVSKPKVTITTSNTYKGEFMFYQNGNLFSSLNQAVDGDLYFFRTNPNPNNKRPMILNIGNIKGGIVNPKEFILLENSTLKIKR